MQPTFRTTSPKNILVALIFFGLVFLGGAAAFFFGDQIPSSWVKENGTITSYRTDYGGSHGPTYCPVITYSVKGAQYTANANVCGGGIPAVGTQAQVAYNPANPSDSKAVTGLGDDFFIGIFALAGLAQLVYAPIAYQKAKNSSSGPASVFTTQWPHAPNQVATTQPGAPVTPEQPAPPEQPITPPVMPPPPPPVEPPAEPPAPPSDPGTPQV